MSDQHFVDAVRAIALRLETYDGSDPQAFARELMFDMTRNGWRHMWSVPKPPTPGPRSSDPKGHIDQCRQALRNTDQETA